ncbi:putative Ig domain-containing protein [Frigoribacterium sp. CG_9.8]|uniref:putative Ig domain-containing protein n=1 Tax=Frigoribacterium sp. CG_9.8 TaxID=2787733 RepID=UPI0018CB8F29|nr:putative Ig domain-containing protein [Frigoribacterium sp. CG_9.8]MBG6108866.1 hypothetical protein [Frigoribacterium sp. CG_9.8]
MTFTINSGALPAGTTLSSAGVLSGTTTTAGTYTYTVTASNGVSPDATSASHTIEVTAGEFAAVTVTPAGGTVAAGGTQAFTATGADQYGNTLGDVTSATTFTITPDGSCSTNTCTATFPGAHTVTATNGAVSGSTELSVIAAALPYVSG